MSASDAKIHRAAGMAATGGGPAEEDAFQSRNPVASAQGFYSERVSR